MLDLIAAAFERQDCDSAAQLLQQWRHSSAADPWVQFYSGRLDEISGKLNAAAEIYRRQLLLSSGQIHAMIVAQARQGLDRIELLVKTQRQQAIAQATADPDRTQKGVLVLEPIASDRNYMFHNGIAFSEQQTHNQTTVKINWNHLQNFLARKLERAEFCSDFTIFAETFLDRSE